MKKNKGGLITATLLISLATSSIYVMNKFIFKSATLKNLLTTKPNDSFYKWRFGNIHYTKTGSGPSLLLIHDLTQYSSSYEWKNLVQDLSNTHTVYTLDLLGCGRSDKPKITYTNFLYVQLLSDFIKNIIKKPTDIIASGLSSSLVITACNNKNDLFGKIMLINPNDLTYLNQSPTKKSKAAKFLLELPILGTLIYNMITAKTNVELLFTETLYYNPFNVDSSLVNTYYEAAHKGNGDGRYLLASIVGKYTNFSILHALKSINNSIFIVGGAHEKNIQETIANYIVHNPAIEYGIISKSKNAPHLEKPDKLLELTTMFFSY